MLFKVFFVVLSILFSSLVMAETVWIDVRSAEEYKLNSIEGDTRITHSEILPKLASLYPDKETEIRLYCRSGHRAGKAMSALIQGGYINVSNAGGIDDARKERGIIEKAETTK